jgi:hypothetical protein
MKILPRLAVRLCFCWLGLLLFFLPGPASAFEGFIDPVDQQFDVTGFLQSQYGFMPMPIVITEPAVGYGGGLGLLYLHDRLGGEPGAEGETTKSKKGPPSISGLFGAATENGTSFGGGFHFGSWKGDAIRYTGGLAIAKVYLDYYGLGRTLNTPVEFRAEALYTSHEIQFRLGSSNFFLGSKYTYVDTDNRFSITTGLPIDIPAIEFSDKNASMSIILAYDSRDNIFTPNRGLQGKFSVSQYHENLGGSNDFVSYLGVGRYYQPLSEKLVLGLRVEGESLDGQAPFYLYPFIKMRGVKLMQYQGEKVLTGETELRWNFYKRWSLIGFYGGGKAYSDVGDKSVVSKGGGFRYLIARGFGLHVGVDVARGPDDTAVYLQFGSAWL